MSMHRRQRDALDFGIEPFSTSLAAMIEDEDTGGLSLQRPSLHDVTRKLHHGNEARGHSRHVRPVRSKRSRDTVATAQLQSTSTRRPRPETVARVVGGGLGSECTGVVCAGEHYDEPPVAAAPYPSREAVSYFTRTYERRQRYDDLSARVRHVNDLISRTDLDMSTSVSLGGEWGRE